MTVGSCNNRKFGQKAIWGGPKLKRESSYDGGAVEAVRTIRWGGRWYCWTKGQLRRGEGS